MGRNSSSIIIYVIIGLALIGIISQIFTNPMTFLKDIFMIIGVGVVLFSIVYFILFRNRTNKNTNEMKKYKQAVKQSQLKYKTNQKTQTTVSRDKNQQRIKRKSNQRASHLRVIDGNRDKPRRKDRATF